MGKGELKYSRYLLKLVKLYYAAVLPLTPANSWKKSWRTKRKDILTNKVFFNNNIKTFRTRYKKEKHDISRYKKYLLDYILCYFLFCLTADEYFQYEFMTKGLMWRNHHITIERRKFIDSMINNPSKTGVLANKAEFNHFYEEYMGRKWCDIKSVSEKEFIKLFSNSSRIIIKPRGYYGGIGVKAYDLNGTEVRKIYNKYFGRKGDFIAEEYLFQEGILHDINPDSLNSIRVTTLRNGSEVEVIDGFFRCGCGDAVVDNFSSGGIIFPYNVKTGEVYTGHSRDNICISEHPLSKIKIKGMVLPDYELIKVEAEKVHKSAPEGLDLVGWDICVIDGKVVLIEGNSLPGYTTLYDPDNKLWQKFKYRFKSI